MSEKLYRRALHKTSNISEAEGLIEICKLRDKALDIIKTMLAEQSRKIVEKDGILYVQNGDSMVIVKPEDISQEPSLEDEIKDLKDRVEALEELSQ